MPPADPHERLALARALLARTPRPSLRAIIRESGLTNHAVRRLAAGKPPRKPAKQPRAIYPPLHPTGKPIRCKCGGLVYPPCKLCHDRAARAA